jgi:hypothetical protein
VLSTAATRRRFPSACSTTSGGREEPLTVYAVGVMTFVSDDGRETKVPYFLTTIDGNPNVVCLRERGGDPFGDFERLIVIARPR